MIWIGMAIGAFGGLVVGWTFGALWGHKKTKKCEDCGENRICPKCKKLLIIA